MPPRSFSEPGKSFPNAQLDREFRSIQSGLNTLLSGDVLITGQWTFDVGESVDASGLPNGPASNTPVIVKAVMNPVEPSLEFQQAALLSLEVTSELGITRTVPAVSSVNRGQERLQFGNANYATVIESLSALELAAPVAFLFPTDGIQYFQSTFMIAPDQIEDPLQRYDRYRIDLFDPERPPLTNATDIATTTMHPDRTLGPSTDFAFQQIWTTAQDYDAATNPRADPIMYIRAAPPEASGWTTADGGSGWMFVPTVDIHDLPEDLGASGQGAVIMRDYDPPSYPDDGRFRVFLQQAAALYIDYTDVIKPGPFAPGSAINFVGGFGYNTNDAAFSLALGTLTIPAGNPGAYSLNAVFTLDIGTGATAVLGVHDNGVAVQGLASAGSTGNQNTVVTLAISGIFPVGGTAHTIDIRVMPSSATVLVVESGQFWIKREFY